MRISADSLLGPDWPAPFLTLAFAPICGAARGEARNGGGDGALACSDLRCLILGQLRVDRVGTEGLNELVDADIPAAVHAFPVSIGAPPLAVDSVLQRVRARLLEDITTVDLVQRLDVDAPATQTVRS